jgi:hypothetical protein
MNLREKKYLLKFLKMKIKYGEITSNIRGNSIDDDNLFKSYFFKGI